MAKQNLTSILAQPEKVLKPKSPYELSKQYDLSPEISEEIARILNTPRTDILSDLPVNEDALGFNALVRTISNVVFSESTQTPITICIDGKWGSGKTSILKMIEAQARMLEFHRIWLNAWNIDSTEDFISTVEEELRREFNLQEAENQPLRHHLEAWKLSPLGFGFGNLVKYLLESKSRHARLIVFVDDIDRAFPDQIGRILKNLKLILESPRCVFILAMDMDIVAQSLENYYETQVQNLSITSLSNIKGRDIYIEPTRQARAARFGYSYLEKLIQIRVEVPPLTRQAVDKYLQEIGIAPEVLEIVRWAPDEEILNPRRLKRYINWLSISLYLIISVPKPPNLSNLTALRALALRYDYPEIYEHILRGGDVSPELIQRSLQRKSPEEDATDFGKYLKKLPPAELKKFDEFLHKTPVLDTRRKRDQAKE